MENVLSDFNHVYKMKHFSLIKIKCDGLKCRSIQRHYRERGKEKEAEIYGRKKDENIKNKYYEYALINLFDKIHTHIVHYNIFNYDNDDDNKDDDDNDN